jgi:hypothetical protein
MKITNLNNSRLISGFTRMTLEKDGIPFTLTPDEQRNEIIISFDGRAIQINPRVSNVISLNLLDDTISGLADIFVTNINGETCDHRLEKLRIEDNNGQNIGFGTTNEGQLTIATVSRLAMMPIDANTLAIRNC